MNKIALLVFIILQGILAIYLGDAFWNPSKYVYTFGGDGAFIYYNMIFHTFFGDGFMLQSMNYPKFESILMTDAQAGLSLVFSNLYDLGPNYFNPENVVGWTHRFHYIMIGFAGVYFFKLLALLDINKYLAGASAILITVLSPMMIRLAAGHFGLAYPFVFAFTFYYLSKLFLDQKLSISHFISFCIVILFFGLNNFYIGMINLTFALLFALFMLALKSHHKLGLVLLIQVILLVGILYAMIHFTDPGMDRVEIQWGYESNRVKILSILAPPTGLLHWTLSKITSIRYNSIETWINLGLATMIISTFGLVLLLLKKITLSKKEHVRLFIGFALVCFVMFLYANASFYWGFLREHFFHKISFLTMFKASARFAWPIYIASTVFAVYLLQEMMKLLPRYVKYITYILLIGITVLEAHFYLNHHVFKQMYGNPYSQQSKDVFQGILEEDQVNLSDYQALYSVPVMEGWNDKFQIEPHFQAEYNSILFSMSTGLPMINGMLSRIGVTDASESIQLSGNPLIQKEKLNDLDATKKILIVYGKGAKKLTIGEQDLIDKSELLTDRDNFQLRSITIDALNSDSTKRAFETFFDTTSTNIKDHFHLGFDEGQSQEKLAGLGSIIISSDTVLLEKRISFESDSLECSIFVKLDNRMYGNPQFFLEFLNDEGSILGALKFNAYQSRDIQNGWVRASAVFSPNPDVSKIKLSVSEVNQNFRLDEFCIYPVNARVQTKKGNGDFLYNNYLITSK